MKALILNGSLKEDKNLVKANEYTEKILTEKGYEVETVILHEKKIGECLGCFGCWVKTPGICVIDDYGRVLTEKIIKSDAVVYLTPVVYGGYSSELKKGIDRIIPLLLPFFKKVNGEVHHKKRYESYPRVVVLGIMQEKDSDMKEIFDMLIRRNSLNWYNSFSGGTVLDDPKEDIMEQLAEKLKALEVQQC